MEAYRAAIGLFNCFRMRCFKFVYSLNHADATLTFLWIAVCIVLRIVLSNDVELNPEPFFKFDHLNARSLNVGDKFEEISLLVRDDEFDVFAVTETWLNNRVCSDCLQIAGYNPIIRLDRHNPFRIITIGYTIVLLQGVHLLITPALDLGFLV